MYVFNQQNRHPTIHQIRDNNSVRFYPPGRTFANFPRRLFDAPSRSSFINPDVCEGLLSGSSISRSRKLLRCQKSYSCAFFECWCRMHAEVCCGSRMRKVSGKFSGRIFCRFCRCVVDLHVWQFRVCPMVFVECFLLILNMIFNVNNLSLQLCLNFLCIFVFFN